MSDTFNGTEFAEMRIRQIAAEVAARADDIQSKNDGLALVGELVERLAREGADRFYLKATCLSLEEAEELAERTVASHCDTVLAMALEFGGTAEMVGDLVERIVNAFGQRLTELNDCAPEDELGRAAQ